MSWYIEGQACYIGRDYDTHNWCTTKLTSQIHYFANRREAEWVLRCMGQLAGKLQLQLRKV